jgi:hypothetical protein
LANFEGVCHKKMYYNYNYNTENVNPL